MRRPLRLHPCLGVPLHEQRRLSTVARWALLELHSGRTDQALHDLQAAAAVTAALVAGGRFTDDARKTAQEAAQALEAVRVNTIASPGAIAKATAVVDLLEQVLRVTTLRRLHAAQDAAAGVVGAAVLNVQGTVADF